MISWISAGLLVTAALAQSGRMERIDPRLKPGDVARLKKKATDLKAIYDAQAKAREELRARQQTEHDELLKTHREARRTFGNEKHTRDERSEFFRNQRTEMSALVARQKEETAKLMAEQKKEREGCHAGLEKGN